MPALEGMHAPHNECAHQFHPAGYTNPLPSDVFRFNRVTPYCPADPCIRPNEGDVVCPPEEPHVMRNHPWMPPAGNDVRMRNEAFRFHKVYPSVGCNPRIPSTCPDGGAVQHGDECLCTNRLRYAPTNSRRQFHYRYPCGATIIEDEPKPTLDLSPCLEDIARARAYSSINHPYEICPARSACQPNIPVHLDSVARPFAHQASTPYAEMVGGMSRQDQFCNEQLPPHSYAVVGNMRYGGNYVFENKKQQILERNAKVRGNLTLLHPPDSNCARPYYPSSYICRPVYNRKYLLDCPTQDGPPADTYTFI